MDVHSPEFLYIGFILPALFALTLIGEGAYKYTQKEEGSVTFIVGVLFLFFIMAGYFLFIYK